jgi:predicted DNA-binding transcriptional regulator AlpA
LARCRHLEQVPDDLVPWTLGKLEVARAVLWSRLACTRSETDPDLPDDVAQTLLTAREVAARLQTSTRWVYRHAAKLGAIRISAHNVRFPEIAVRRFLKRRAE